VKSSTKDNAEGKMHQMKGKIKEVVGKIVKNRELEAEGKAENLDCQLFVHFLHPFSTVLFLKPFDDEMTSSHLLKMVHEEKID
jgi:hypothetical protein